MLVFERNHIEMQHVYNHNWVVEFAINDVNDNNRSYKFWLTTKMDSVHIYLKGHNFIFAYSPHGILFSECNIFFILEHCIGTHSFVGYF